MFDDVEPPNGAKGAMKPDHPNIGPCKACWALEKFGRGAELIGCRLSRSVEEWPAAVGASRKAWPTLRSEELDLDGVFDLPVWR